MKTKGQVFTPDFTASIALFSLFIIIFGVVWNTSLDTFTQSQGMEKIQHDYTFSLLRTRGNPTNWNSSNVEIPGLYTKEYISAEKFLELYDVDISDQKRILRANEFHLRLQYLNGTIVEHRDQKLEIFTGPDSTDSIVPENNTVYASRRLGVLKETGERVEMRYYTWK